MGQEDLDLSLGDSIYRALSDALVRGRLEPEQRLKIRVIAAEMGTSVTPVRDAILRLVQERALYLRSPRDIRVRSVSYDEYLEVRAIRVELEGKAAEVAAERATPEEIRLLDRIVRENARALRSANKALATELNQRFHFEIARMSRMPVLADMLRRMWLSMGPWITENYDMAAPSMIDFHKAAVIAIKARDPVAARGALRDDLVIAGNVILANERRRTPLAARTAHGTPIADALTTK